MTAVTDCGNYSCKWSETGFGFLNSMSEFDTEYLLCHVAKKDKFDYNNTIKNIKDIFKNTHHYEAVEKLLDEADFYSDEYDFVEYIKLYDDFDIFESPDIWEYIMYDYPLQAKIFVELFTTYIQPQIKKVLNVLENRGLEPCPFCGGEPETVRSSFGTFYIRCERCGATASFVGNEEKESAIKMYNRRG
jgi:Lar family restriction alleviation protein